MIEIMNLIPDYIYKVFFIGIVFLIMFWKKIPILNKIRINIILPEEFMRHFRWLTPLFLVILLLSNIGFAYVQLKLYQALKELRVEIFRQKECP